MFFLLTEKNINTLHPKVWDNLIFILLWLKSTYMKSNSCMWVCMKSSQPTVKCTVPYDKEDRIQCIYSKGLLQNYLLNMLSFLMMMPNWPILQKIFCFRKYSRWVFSNTLKAITFSLVIIFSICSFFFILTKTIVFKLEFLHNNLSICQAIFRYFRTFN